MGTLCADLSGEIATVTGAASGLGKEIALTMAQSGAAVGAADINVDGANAVAEQVRKRGGRAIGVPMDVTSEDAVNGGVDAVVGRFGSLDILVSIAGIQIVSAIVDFSHADWRKMQAIQMDGVFPSTKEDLRRIYKDNRDGLVIYGIYAFRRCVTIEIRPRKC